MASAKQCDRCGKFYSNYQTTSGGFNGILTANIDQSGKYYSKSIYDLCPECMEQLIEWLENKSE